VAHEVILSRAAEKNLDRIPRDVRLRILNSLDELPANPRPPGSVKLKGEDELWRLRVGDYRIVYTIRDKELIILVVRVAHRKDVYREK
jgi:mRNA interferase RelE/StbE